MIRREPVNSQEFTPLLLQVCMIQIIKEPCKVSYKHIGLRIGFNKVNGLFCKMNVV